MANKNEGHTYRKEKTFEERNSLWVKQNAKAIDTIKELKSIPKEERRSIKVKKKAE